MIAKLRIGAAAMVAAIACTLVMASPAQASGGGCNTLAEGSWNIGVCSSDDGRYVRGDAYINKAPSSSTYSSCDLVLQTFDNEGNQRYQWYYGCGVGHHGGGDLVVNCSLSTRFRTYGEIRLKLLNGSQSIPWAGYSPWSYC